MIPFETFEVTDTIIIYYNWSIEVKMESISY